MNAWKFTAALQKPAALAIILSTILLAGCAKQESSSMGETIAPTGAYIEHATGKSYALVFDGAQVSTWMYYPDKGPVIQSSAYKVCLTKGAKFTVSGQTVQISGGAAATAGTEAAPFPVPGSGQDATLQMLSHGFVLQLSLNGGKSVNFVKSV